jgi:hypothetical protein
VKSASVIAVFGLRMAGLNAGAVPRNAIHAVTPCVNQVNLLKQPSANGGHGISSPFCAFFAPHLEVLCNPMQQGPRDVTTRENEPRSPPCTISAAQAQKLHKCYIHPAVNIAIPGPGFAEPHAKHRLVRTANIPAPQMLKSGDKPTNVTLI